MENCEAILLNRTLPGVLLFIFRKQVPNTVRFGIIIGEKFYKKLAGYY